jgi:hypothetical protein
MRRIASILGLAAAIVAVVGARGAELPTMKSAPPERLKACNVGGMAGVVVPGSGACVKIGGYVSGGVEVGNVKQPSNGAAEFHN